MQSLHQIITDYFQSPAFVALPLHLIVLIGLLLYAAAVDVRERRIPNWLVATGTIFGVLFHASSDHGAGASFALYGAGLGLVALFPLFALGLLGAGDVKLVGMVGSFLGLSSVAGVILASMTAGGILALAMAAGKRMLPQLLANLRLMLVQRHIRQMSGAGAMPPPPSVGKMPYALAICAGTLFQLFFLA